MTMDEIKIMTPGDLEDVFHFEMSQIAGAGIEKEMQAWHAPWRREALEHYAQNGWSFLKREDGVLKGYILCQPVLFFQSWTQTLWIEHVSARTADVGQTLIEVAYRWSRDKHLQKVFFKKNLPFSEGIQFAPVDTEGEFQSLKTTKM